MDPGEQLATVSRVPDVPVLGVTLFVAPSNRRVLAHLRVGSAISRRAELWSSEHGFARLFRPASLTWRGWNV